MNNSDLWAMILDLVEELDYDLYKALLPELAEDPEFLETQKERLILIARKHLTKGG